MSEMLGNQFFMARNYPAAERELEEVFIKDPFNRSVKKKLVVCYTQTGKIKEAINIFSELINEDIEFIINTDPILDDCPCPELVEKIENESIFFENPYEHNLTLGILWLYCDEKKSLEFFRKLHDLEPNNDLINQTIQKIELFLSEHSS
jgi:tetratricopeptide (TPR) repeat protein